MTSKYHKLIINNNKLLFAIIAILWLSVNVNAQVSNMAALGGEVWYELHSQDGVTGSVLIHTTRLYNPTKGLSFQSKFNLFNYPMSTYAGRNRWLDDTVKLNCNINFLDTNIQPTVSSRQDGVYKISRWYTTTNLNSIIPFTLPFLSSPPTNGWVLAVFSDIDSRDTTAKNIVNFPYNNMIHQQWEIHKNCPTLFTRVYPFPNISGPHNDTSPRFASDAVVVCTSGDTVNYNPNIYDADGDSISVDWDYHINGYHYAQYTTSLSAWPIGNLPQDISAYHLFLDTATYKPGYDFNKPLPDASFNPNNIAATLDSNTGEIYFCCNNPGNYSAAVKVSAFRNGYLLSTTHREIFFTVFPADSNHDPIITNPNSIYIDTVFAGDSVSIPFYISDLDSSQQITFNASGYAMDSNLLVDGTACGLPPCAGFSKLPTVGFHALDTAIFAWHTSCSNTSANNNMITYNFNLTAMDDNCPIAGMGNRLVRIVVKNNPILEAAQPHCTQVSTNTNVTLLWNTIADSTGFSFKKYIIWTSQSPIGPFAPLDTITDINQTSIVHDATNALSNQLFYFIETVSSCSPSHSAFSDTISTIYLQLNNAIDIANLSWNDIRYDTINQYYKIYRSIDGAAWALLDSCNATIYNDSLSVCSLAVSYYISLSDSSGCESISNIKTDTFTDITAPEPIVWDSISLSTNNKIQLAWLSSNSDDVVAYIIYNQAQAIDTIWGTNSCVLTNYIYSDTNNCFNISAMDSCGNATLSDTNCSIELQTAIDKCTQGIIISWKANNDTTLLSYDLFYKQNAGTFQYLANISSGDTSFIHSSLIENQSYCYFIRAKLSGNRSSSSNRECIITNFSENENKTSLRVASVANNNFVRLKIESDTIAKSDKYIIERRDNATSNFVNIANISNQYSALWWFDDAAVDVQTQYYQYRILSKNSCQEYDTSNYAQTILLNIEQRSGNINQLQWNSYQQWSYGVDYYIIHRIVQQMEVFPYITVPSNSAMQYSYDDDVSEFENYSNEFCYSIEALEASANIDTSFSNTACIARDLDIYIPNAFHPGGGINEVFKPVIPFLNDNYYQMIIYNRWGEKIFETTDINIGWDGTYKSYTITTGVYVYIISIISNGEKISRRGSFTLIR